jgi:molecular chaperone GrpE
MSFWRLPLQAFFRSWKPTGAAARRIAYEPKDNDVMFTKNKEKTKSHEKPAQPEATPPSEAAAPAEAAPAPQPAAPETPAADPARPSPEAAELAAFKDRYTRLMADFDNFRKRQTREREEWIKRANEELLGDLLPIIDHLELALDKNADPSDAFAAGVKMVYDQFIAFLDHNGVTPIDSKGQPFNPAFHEALSQMSSATVPAQVVIDQFRRGWLLAGRLLRPAQVIVSSGAPDPEQAVAESESVSD